LIRKIALAVVALVITYAVYLTWRVIDERRDVGAHVDAVIARADADEVNLPKRRVAMLLRVEDPTFWSNDGVDFSTSGAGMTTISQSLGKRIFFEHFKPGFRKGELLALTRFALVPQVAKDKILKAWLARTYLGTRNGRSVTGFADGARTWIGKPLRDLDDREFLTLVAMLPAPDRLKPTRDLAGNRERVRRIERLLSGTCQPAGLRDVMLEGCA